MLSIKLTTESGYIGTW